MRKRLISLLLAVILVIAFCAGCSPAKADSIAWHLGIASGADIQTVMISGDGMTLKDIMDGKTVDVSNTPEGVRYVTSFLEDKVEVITGVDSYDMKSVCGGMNYIFREGNGANILSASITVFRDAKDETVLFASVSNLDHTLDKHIYLRLHVDNEIYSADFVKNVVDKYAK